MTVFLRTRKYKCCICHKELERFNVIRLVEQTYDDNRFKNTGHNYDYCTDCYKIFSKWIKKHKIREVENELLHM